MLRTMCWHNAISLVGQPWNYFHEADDLHNNQIGSWWRFLQTDRLHGQLKPIAFVLRLEVYFLLAKAGHLLSPRQQKAASDQALLGSNAEKWEARPIITISRTVAKNCIGKYKGMILGNICNHICQCFGCKVTNIFPAIFIFPLETEGT